MEEIIHAFGIDWRLIVIQMFNFAVLAGALWYFLYTPVLGILKEREAKLKKGVEDAEAAGVARTEADVERQQVLKGAHTEAGDIVTRARVHAEEKEVTILNEAAVRAERALADAAQKAEEIKARAHKESEAEIAQLAILAAEKVLRERSHS
jgi:F-type H+-transporting ATPase subunit b